MNDVDITIILALTALGFYAAGRLHGMRRAMHWRIVCIHLEHRLTKHENREPEEIAPL
jgi:hypothetical protein